MATSSRWRFPASACCAIQSSTKIASCPGQLCAAWSAREYAPMTGEEVVPVLIAGGGPVGLTLAYDLASRGIRCMLVERQRETTRHPKMDITNSRTMELFRRAGLAEALRAVAVPEDHPFD